MNRHGFTACNNNTHPQVAARQILLAAAARAGKFFPDAKPELIKHLVQPINQ